MSIELELTAPSEAEIYAEQQALLAQVRQLRGAQLALRAVVVGLLLTSIVASYYWRIEMSVFMNGLGDWSQLLAFVLMILVGCLICVPLWLNADKLKIKSQEARDRATLLFPSSREDCLQIKGWLSNPVIAKYRDMVTAQGRMFTQAEVLAMKQFVEEDTRNKEMDQACRDVYLPAASN